MRPTPDSNFGSSVLGLIAKSEISSELANRLLPLSLRHEAATLGVLFHMIS